MLTRALEKYVNSNPQCPQDNPFCGYGSKSNNRTYKEVI